MLLISPIALFAKHICRFEFIRLLLLNGSSDSSSKDRKYQEDWKDMAQWHKAPHDIKWTNSRLFSTDGFSTVLLEALSALLADNGSEGDNVPAAGRAEPAEPAAQLGRLDAAQALILQACQCATQISDWQATGSSDGLQ